MTDGRRRRNLTLILARVRLEHGLDLQQVVLGEWLVNGLEAQVRRVREPAQGQEAGVAVPEPRDGSIADVLHAAVEQGRLLQHGRHVARELEVEARRRLLWLTSSLLTSLDVALIVVTGVDVFVDGPRVVNLPQVGFDLIAFLLTVVA